MHLLNLWGRLIWNHWKKSVFHQSLAALTLGSLLALGGSLLFFSRSLEPVIQEIAMRQQVIAFVRSDVPDEKKSQVVDEVRITLGSAPQMQPKIQWLDRKEFVESLSGESPKLAEQIFSLGKEFDSIVPRMILIEGIQETSQWEALKKLSTIENVEWSTHQWKPVLSALRGFRLGALVLGGVLWIAAIFGLFQWVRGQKVAMESNLRIIELMGGSWSARWTPIFLMGLMIGLPSAIVSAAIWAGYSMNFTSGVQSLSPLFARMLQPSGSWALLMAAGAMLLSLGVTSVGFSRWRA